MKKLINAYTFNPESSLITFPTGLINSLEQILLITDVSNNTIIYNFADSTKGGVFLNDVLYLSYNTSVGFGASDRLQIYVDLPTSDNEVLIADLKTVLIDMVHELQSLKARTPYPDVNGRNRVMIEGGSVGITTNQDLRNITGAVANVSLMGGISPTLQMQSTTNLAWGNLRKNIISS